MNVKKEVVNSIITNLEKEQKELRYKCFKNAGTIKTLAEQNTKNKREIAMIGDLIYELNKKQCTT